MAAFNKDKIFGALLVGTYANTILYTLEMVAIVQYYLASKRNRDSFPLKAIVYFTFVVDTFCTGTVCSSVYLYTVTHWGDFNFLRQENPSQYRSEAMSIPLNGITAMVVQSFLIYRYWRMSQNYYITSVLILSALTAFGGALATTVSTFAVLASGGLSKLFLCTMIWLISSAVTDVAIAAVLLWHLSRIKSAFRKTNSLIHRLMAYTISSGTVTSAVAMLIVILFSAERNNYVSTGFMFCLGRIYSLTMLYNLNYRSSQQESTNTTDVLSLERSQTLNNTKGIHVHRTTAVHDGSQASHGPVSVDLSDRSPDSDLFPAREKVHALPLEP